MDDLQALNGLRGALERVDQVVLLGLAFERDPQGGDLAREVRDVGILGSRGWQDDGMGVARHGAAAIEVELVRGRVGDDAALEVALAEALLHAVASGARGPIVRSYRPRPTVAFGRQDSLLAGFATAAAAARAHRFEPVLRAPGGHAAAYDERCLVLDEIVPSTDSISGVEDRFRSEAERHAQALRGLGVEATIGGVPGEYCAGRFSVGARGKVKLIGTAQRIVRGAWLLSTVVVVAGEDRLRAVLSDVYAALRIDWDPRTVGSVERELPGVSLDHVERALLCGYAARYRLLPAAIEPRQIAAAQMLLGRHRVARQR